MPPGREPFPCSKRATPQMTRGGFDGLTDGPADPGPADAVRAAPVSPLKRRKVNKEEHDTIERVLSRFYQDHVDGLKSAHEVKRLLSKELKGWKRRRVDEISRADAIKLIEAQSRRAEPRPRPTERELMPENSLTGAPAKAWSIQIRWAHPTCQSRDCARTHPRRWRATVTVDGNRESCRLAVASVFYAGTSHRAAARGDCRYVLGRA